MDICLEGLVLYAVICWNNAGNRFEEDWYVKGKTDTCMLQAAANQQKEWHQTSRCDASCRRCNLSSSQNERRPMMTKTVISEPIFIMIGNADRSAGCRELVCWWKTLQSRHKTLANRQIISQLRRGSSQCRRIEAAVTLSTVHSPPSPATFSHTCSEDKVMNIRPAFHAVNGVMDSIVSWR